MIRLELQDRGSFRIRDRAGNMMPDCKEEFVIFCLAKWQTDPQMLLGQIVAHYYEAMEEMTAAMQAYSLGRIETKDDALKKIQDHIEED